MALLTKVKTRMAIHAHRKVRGLLDGQYASIQTGRSMDFHDLRDYVAGDEVKDLDWKASARRGSLLIRRYVADRKHTVMVLAATSRTMSGMCDPENRKSDLAVMVAGVIGWLAVKHGDRVGLVTGNAETTHTFRPGSTEVELERMLQKILDGCDSKAPDTDLAAVLAYAVRTVRRQTIMVVLTDDLDLTAAQERQLRRLRAQHEILFVTFGDLDPTDPQWRSLPLHDLDAGQAVPDFLRNDPALHAEVATLQQARHSQRRKALERLGIASEHVTSEAGVVGAVFRLLERHRHGK